MGPVVDKRQLDIDLQYLEIAKEPAAAKSLIQHIGCCKGKIRGPLPEELQVIHRSAGYLRGGRHIGNVSRYYGGYRTSVGVKNTACIPRSNRQAQSCTVSARKFARVATGQWSKCCRHTCSPRNAAQKFPACGARRNS
jgi:hypothetical protein